MPCPPSLVLLEEGSLGKLQGLKYQYCDCADISDRASLEQNFREKFEALNRVLLTDGELAHLPFETVTPSIFHAAKLPRQINSFTRSDNTPSKRETMRVSASSANQFDKFQKGCSKENTKIDVRKPISRDPKN